MASMFGTDGVRGTPGRYPLDPETVARVGAATVRVFGAGARLVAARDTRESGPLIESQLARGVSAEGGTLTSVGVLPTPAASWLASSDEFDGGFVISASHNPFPDNGIKLLTGAGEKASSELEMQVAALVDDRAWNPTLPTSFSLETKDRRAEYERFVSTVLPGGAAWSGAPRIAVDCANGATSVVAPHLLAALGLDVVVRHAEPNGCNINDGCGSTHPQSLVRVVGDEACGVGAAFDGDGDRVILVDAHGAIVDGDAMLFVCATHLRSTGRLPGNAIVATVMSNIGLERALAQAGIVVHRCPVGDRSVREAMRRLGVALGGEQSGHVIFDEYLPTGDGLITLLSVLRVMRETGRELADLADGFHAYPQVLLNVRVRRTPDLASEPDVTEAVRRAERRLDRDGRVVVRYSGTEPILRIMIEGPDQNVVRELAESIADLARDRLG